MKKQRVGGKCPKQWQIRQVDVRSCSVVSRVRVFFSENRLSSWYWCCRLLWEIASKCKIGFAGVVDTVRKMACDLLARPAICWLGLQSAGSACDLLDRPAICWLGLRSAGSACNLLARPAICWIGLRSAGSACDLLARPAICWLGLRSAGSACDLLAGKKGGSLKRHWQLSWPGGPSMVPPPPTRGWPLLLWMATSATRCRPPRSPRRRRSLTWSDREWSLPPPTSPDLKPANLSLLWPASSRPPNLRGFTRGGSRGSGTGNPFPRGSKRGNFEGGRGGRGSGGRGAGNRGNWSGRLLPSLSASAYISPLCFICFCVSRLIIFCLVSLNRVWIICNPVSLLPLKKKNIVLIVV